MFFSGEEDFQIEFKPIRLTTNSTTTISPEEIEIESSKIINEVQNTISGIIKDVVASRQNDTNLQNYDDIVRLINDKIPSDIAIKSLELDKGLLKDKIRETVGEILTDGEKESVVRLKNRTEDGEGRIDEDVINQKEREEEDNAVEDMILLNSRVPTTTATTSTSVLQTTTTATRPTASEAKTSSLTPSKTTGTTDSVSLTSSTTLSSVFTTPSVASKVSPTAFTTTTTSTTTSSASASAEDYEEQIFESQPGDYIDIPNLPPFDATKGILFITKS